MILIMGVRTRFRADPGGTFSCPNEGADRPYELVEARRWFTAFFIPLIPLKVLGTFVRCTRCHAEYDRSVLTMPTTGVVMDRLTAAVRHAVVAMILADGTIDDRERTTALEVVNRFSSTRYTAEELEADLTELAGSDLEQVMGQVGAMLETPGHERLVTACVHVAMADDAVDETELATIARAGRGLGMSPAHVRGVIAEAMEDARSA